MTMHCAGRLGVLSWIYEQRHVIAFELGLIDEKPIAECGTGYLDDGLVIMQQDDTAHTSAVFQAKEIKLFFVSESINIDAGFSVIRKPEPVYIVTEYPPCIKAIFHPPSIA